jgi:hypothetical protein
LVKNLIANELNLFKLKLYFKKIVKGFGGFFAKADSENDDLAQAFLCLWKAHINGELATAGVTDSCFSSLTQTQLILDIKSGLDIAFSQPSLSSTASQSVNKMAKSFKCLKTKMTGFTEQSTRETVVENANACFPSQDSTSQQVVSSVISSFDLLALNNSS